MSEDRTQDDKKNLPDESPRANKILLKMGFGFMEPIELAARHTKNHYIIMATDYTTKCIEARAINDNTMKSTVTFLYEKIITKFRC